MYRDMFLSEGVDSPMAVEDPQPNRGTSKGHCWGKVQTRQLEYYYVWSVEYY